MYVLNVFIHCDISLYKTSHMCNYIRVYIEMSTVILKQIATSMCFLLSAFQSVPPALQRRQPNQDIRMEWVLPEDDGIINAANTRFYYDYTGSVDSWFVQLRYNDGGFTVDIDDSYEGRVTGYYIAQNLSVGFTLAELGLYDAGTYGCRHVYGFEIVEHYTPVLFIYGKCEI